MSTNPYGDPEEQKRGSPSGTSKHRDIEICADIENGKELTSVVGGQGIMGVKLLVQQRLD